MIRSFPTTLLALCLAACGGEPTSQSPAPGAAPAAKARQLTLTYFTMSG